MIKAIFLLLTSCFAMAQNLVPNPSFETYISCPSNLTQISNVSQWNRPSGATGTPDYFNRCNTGIVGVPNNNFGTQEPFDGDGYVGITTWYHNPPLTNVREYIQTQLTAPLVAGQTYQVSFYVCLGENTGLASNNLGAVFTVNQLAGNTNQPINATPQFLYQGIVSGTTNWTQVSGTFVAAGNERYLTIGNFLNNTQTLTQVANASYPATQAFYYLDYVSVTSVLGQEEFDSDKVSIFPNPVADTFSIAAIGAESVTAVELYSSYQLVQRFNPKETTFDVKKLSSGIYYLIVTFESNKKRISKLIKL